MVRAAGNVVSVDRVSARTEAMSSCRRSNGVEGAEHAAAGHRERIDDLSSTIIGSTQLRMRLRTSSVDTRIADRAGVERAIARVLLQAAASATLAAMVPVDASVGRRRVATREQQDEHDEPHGQTSLRSAYPNAM
jgi:hypothetical protein